MKKVQTICFCIEYSTDVKKILFYVEFFLKKKNNFFGSCENIFRIFQNKNIIYDK